MADNVQTLTKGEFIIRARDGSNSDLTVVVEVVPGGTPSTESKVFKRVSGASIYQLEYSPEVDFEDFPGFFQARDTVDRDDPVAIAEYETSATNELRDPLPVTLVP